MAMLDTRKIFGNPDMAGATFHRSHISETDPLLPPTDDKHDIVSFGPDDPECPYNWARWRKYLLVFSITLIDLTVSFGASGYSPGKKSFQHEFHVGDETAQLGLSMYVLGLAGGPMALAPLSEYFGRSPIYIVSYGIFLLFLIGTALVHTLRGFLALRILSGFCASVTLANFGGTIADIQSPHDTGPMMSVFMWAATIGSPMGYFLLSAVAQNYEWRAVFWALLAICGSCWLLMCVVLTICGETRHGVLLQRRLEGFQKELKEQGKFDEADRLALPKEMRGRGIAELFRVTLARPFRFLATEAIIQSAAAYNGYLFGLSFTFDGALPIVFGEGHGFDTFQVGLCFLGIIFGISCGPFTNIWQERYYQRSVKASGGANVPESRVQMGKWATNVMSVSLFCFSWTTDPRIPPIVPIIASAFWGWSFYTLILMTYSYTEDSYKYFSASALAGIGFIRNLAGAGLPLLGEKMFKDLGPEKAGSVLGGLSCVLIPIPFVLEKYGRELRKRSPWAWEHVDDLSSSEDPVNGDAAHDDGSNGDAESGNGPSRDAASGNGPKRDATSGDRPIGDAASGKGSNRESINRDSTSRDGGFGLWG